MYTRSNSLVLSLSAADCRMKPQYFGNAHRRTEPEIFTFEPFPETDPNLERRRSSLQRSRRRAPRVMYPSKVKKYLPPAEKSLVKRWLIVLFLVVLWQIYTEEPCQDTPSSSDDTREAGAALSGDLLFNEYQVLSFISADVHIPEMDTLTEEPQAEQEPPEVQNSTCPDPDSYTCWVAMLYQSL